MNYQNYGQKNSQQFEIREGGGCLSVFGLPFFCAGIFLLLASLKVIPFQNKDEIPFWGWIGMFFMSLPFIGIGGALLFGRRQTRIDLAEGRIFKESKVFVPVKTEAYLIVDYKTVMIRFESGSSDSPGHTTRSNGSSADIKSLRPTPRLFSISNQETQPRWISAVAR